MTQRPNITFWHRGDIRTILAARDIPALYRALQRAGLRQQDIAEVAGQRQSEVSAIVHGQPVLRYDVLARIADGFGIHRGWMGLAYDEQTNEMLLLQGDDTKEDPDMRRRAAIGNMLALASVGVVGSPVLGQATQIEHLMMATPPPVTVGGSDIAALRAWVAALRTLGRAGHPDIVNTLGDAIRRVEAMRPAASGTTAADLRGILSDLYLLCGWYHHDIWLTNPARWHYNRALTLAEDDAVQRAAILSFAGTTERDVGRLNDALKFHDLGLMGIDRMGGHELWSIWMHLGAGGILAKMGGHDDAVHRRLSLASDMPPPVDTFQRADMACARAGTLFALGDLDGAERYAAESTRTFLADDRRDSLKAQLRLATIHVTAGESDAPELARRALTAVAAVPSPRIRYFWLPPLERALRDRGGATRVSLADRVAELRRSQRSVPSNQRSAATAC